MLGILANTFRTATRMDLPPVRRPPHWPPAERFDTRAGAELEAHLTARRRF
ncbi:MAG: hypothetical protein KBT70_03705 [Roseovarius sp.]|uniref:hypothetical protein n=1 Tax=Roseovarius sp. TaxID=1486281 RepID=UPI001B667A56|nr:hypothetical protein [Roseovarius sp.]MBQ0749282.1 hypothetical protein [Roseovarius sp.]MBQ0810106.1 hypothetical protein [Roseovarius sp.]